MKLRGNQGAVTINQNIAYKKYHGNREVSNLDYFLYEVENLKKIKTLNGELIIFQLPIILDYDITSLTIKMTAIDRRLPYIVDFCPMIRDRAVFDRFLVEVFSNYVCEQHNLKPTNEKILILKNALKVLADAFSIFYTDPKPSNVFLG